MSRVLVPLAQGCEEMEAVTPGGHETILLVEDDAAARLMTEKMLRRLGYTVLSAGNGKEALARLDGNTIDLLITDVVLPGMGGRELAEAVRERASSVKVLFATGYTEDEKLKRRIADQDVALLPKPFTRAALARKVREVLTAP